METKKNNSSSRTVWIVAVIILVCCSCLILLAFGLYRYLGPGQASQLSTDTISILENKVVPINNPRELACQLSNKCNIPQTAPSGPFDVNAKQKFWVANNDTAKSFQIDATLQYVTPHAYFWVQDGVNYNLDDAKKLMDTFENEIYPTNRDFFGSEWSPGVDEDVHLYLLYAQGIGKPVAGYFSSPDEYLPATHPYSNAHEMFVFNANMPLSNAYTYSVLAHEFQHMIHWNQDRNESTWINEGFSEVAVLLNGYNPGGVDLQYAGNPDLQLTDWGADVGSNGPHYGAAFLFLTYFLDRFGKDATQQLVHDPLNGLDSIDDVLNTAKITDAVTGQPIRADDVFMDWAVTNYLLDGSIGDGRYIYKIYKTAPKIQATKTIIHCPAHVSDTVHQYGVDYIQVVCSGKFNLHFEGDRQTKLIGAPPPPSGNYSFWSNKGDQSDMTLTHDFDFSGVSSPITLKYRTWYDLEKDYDYVFVEASTDGGKTWPILKTPSCTVENPSGNSYGCGYNNTTNGWVDQQIDLSQFAGKKVQIRYQYVTDTAVNGEGFLLDDVSIPEINYSTDFETDDGGWQSAGFARIQNNLPQTFRLSLISKKDGQTTVQNIPVNPDQTADISLDTGGANDAVLVISGMTRYTRVEANYSIMIE